MGTTDILAWMIAPRMAVATFEHSTGALMQHKCSAGCQALQAQTRSAGYNTKALVSSSHPTPLSSHVAVLSLSRESVA